MFSASLRLKNRKAPRYTSRIVQYKRLLHKVGVAKKDITGPIGAQMKGYGTFQPSEGIHMRQYARAFVFQDEKSEDKVAFVSLDMHSTSQKLKQMVVHHLRKSQGLWGEFTEDNIMLCASHTHSGIGGYDLHALYELNVPSQGWREWVNTIINPSHTGILEEYLYYLVANISEAISTANLNLKEAEISYTFGNIQGCSVNCSPSAFLRNKDYKSLPISTKQKEIYKECYKTITKDFKSAAALKFPKKEEEVLKFPKDDSNFMMKFVDPKTGLPFGMISYFPVHGTSLPAENKYISSDNKGVAQYFFEKSMSPNQIFGHQNSFTAAFCQSNCGDISPNIRGERGPNGEFSDEFSCIDGDPGKCRGEGPGQEKQRSQIKDINQQREFEMESTKIIGYHQFCAAKSMFEKMETKNQNFKNQNIRSVLVKVNMSQYQLTNVTLDLKHKESTKAKLKGPRVGLASAAGTSDNPQHVEFPVIGVVKQGAFNDDNVDYALAHGMAEHHPRVQLLSDPNAFSKDGPLSPDVVPHVLPLQILQIGNIFVLGVPAEFTSMAGMILRENVRKFLEENNVENPVVTIAGLSNAYSQYVTTPLEYDSQRHEGACTLFGRWTLYAYVELFLSMAEKIIKQLGTDVEPDYPKDLPFIFTQKNLPWENHNFLGNLKITKDVHVEYIIGKDEKVEFQVETHHPGGDFSYVNFFFFVEKKSSESGKNISDGFQPILSEADFETLCHYNKEENLFTFTWDLRHYSKLLAPIPPPEPGIYRISYNFIDPNTRKLFALSSTTFSLKNQ